MNDKDFKKAINLKKEINELSNFIYYCKKNWWKLTIKKIHKILNLHTSYGCISKDITISEKLAKRILKTIEEYKNELEKEYDSL